MALEVIAIQDVFGRDFPPRGDRGQWFPWFRELYQWCHYGQAVCMMSIGLTLLVTALAECRDPRIRHVIALNQAERKLLRIVLCLFFFTVGFGNFEHVIAFGAPEYHLFALWSCLSFAVSFATLLVVARFRLQLVTVF